MSTTQSTDATPPRPAILAVHVEGIPRELILIPQWVWWRLEFRPDKNGKKPWTKSPFDPKSNRGAMAKAPDWREKTRKKYGHEVDPATTWGTFEKALAMLPGGDGIGFELSPDDEFSGIDLDKCRDPETGAIAEWAQKIIDRIPSYWEVSPTGTGVRCFLRGKLPTGRRRKGNVEMYDSGRYLTVTGHALAGRSATIENCQAELEALHAALWPPESSETTTPALSAPAAIDDQMLLAKAFAAKNGDVTRTLWEGKDDGYASPSEADLALLSRLAFYTGNDPGRLDSLFRQSARMREKWEREDYRAGTIDKAISGCKEFYRWNGNVRHTAVASDAVPVATSVKVAIESQRRPGELESAKSPIEPEGQTDLANARRFVEMHGLDVRYCHPWKKWLVWDGRRWKVDDDGTPIRLAKDVADGIWNFARQCDATTLLKFAAQSAGRQRIEAMLVLAQSEVAILPKDLDSDPWLLNCPNGTVDLRTGELREHRREDYITKLCPTEIDPDAGSYIWDRFQDDVSDGDGALIEFKRRLYGYCATGIVSEQILPIFYGAGANGKSTELEAITGALGPDYSGAAPKDLLMVKRGESHPTEIADLHGKRLITAQETERNRTLNESLVKALTGGDTLKARRMREDFWQFRPTHKLILCTNHKPRVKGTDHAIWRRLRLVPFVVKFDGDRRDKSMPEKLRTEQAGILAWIVRGAVDWHASGLCEPDCVRAATEEYRSSQDLIAEFIADCCTLGESLWTPSAQLMEAFEAWCKERGEHPPRGKTFAEGLERHDCEKSRKSAARGWQGIGLLSESTMTL